MLYFIVNPNAGGAKGYQIWKAAENRLQKLKVPYKVYVTAGRQDAVRIAREISFNDDAREDEKTIVAVGGDGTFNEVLNGLNISDKITLSYIPTGSGNDLARGLGLSNNVIKCIDNILSRKNIIEMDYGVLTFGDNEVVNRRFAVSAGVGYDAAVCVAIEKCGARGRLSKIKLQKQAYLLIGAMEILKTKTSRGYLILDETRKIEFNDIAFISAHNHVTEGGGKKFAPQADFQDGLLSLCIMHSKSKAQFAKILAKGIAGNHPKEQGVRTLDCKSVRIHMYQPMPIHTDGEVFPPQKDIEIQCVERKLKIII